MVNLALKEAQTHFASLIKLLAEDCRHVTHLAPPSLYMKSNNIHYLGGVQVAYAR